MASLRELKKKLQSVRSTGQLTGAMRTVSAAKYSKLSGALGAYRTFAAACEETLRRFPGGLEHVLPQSDPDAPACYVVLTSNRGLCGDYNISLLALADGVLERAAGASVLIVCGQVALAHFQKLGRVPDRVFPLGDTPGCEDCRPLCEELLSGYREGRYSSVTFIYQHMVNLLLQKPTVQRVLPPEGAAEGAGAPECPVCLPDKATVLQAVALKCLDTLLYSIILDAFSGAQAATMMAMRTAYDNATKAAARLELEISRQRQSSVTSSVIESAEYQQEE